MRARLGERDDGTAGQVRSVTLFGADAAALPYELQALEYFTQLGDDSSPRRRVYWAQIAKTAHQRMATTNRKRRRTRR